MNLVRPHSLPYLFSRFMQVAAVLLLFGVAATSQSQAARDESPSAPSDLPETCYLFSYFTGNGEDGLHLAWSRDGYSWVILNQGKSYLTPTVGESKLMRDPCLLRGPDGVFRLVWTTAWKGVTIGYSSSKDLLSWTTQQAMPVMAAEPTTLNCWAPEIVYDAKKKDYVIFWASTIPGKFPATAGTGDNDYNHRIYATRTRDFMAFAPTWLFYDPGFNVIDATMLSANGKYYLIVKDETKQPPKKHLRIASSDSVEGPFADLSAPFTRDWVEGPTAIQIGNDYLVYFDVYREKHYGAMKSHDLKTWEDVTSKLAFPPGARHGTVIAVPKNIIERLERAGSLAKSPREKVEK